MMTPPVMKRVQHANWTGPAIKLLVDVVLLNLATVVSAAARLDFDRAPWALVYSLRFPGIVENLLFVAISLLAGTVFTLWSYTSLHDVARVGLVVLVTKLLALPLLVGLRREVAWSVGAFAASAVLCFLFMTFARAGVRWWYEHDERWRRAVGVASLGQASPRVLVVGAGEAGDKILREFESHRDLGTVVGLLDDDPAKRGCTLRGVRVLGSVADVAAVAAKVSASQVVIAIPSHAAVVTRKVVSSLADTEVQVRTLPAISELVNGSVRFDDVRSVQLEDLLVRSPVVMDSAPVRAYVEGRRVLVTGAGGSIGSEIVRQVALLKPSMLIMLGRGENRIFSIDRELRDQRRSVHGVPVIGDMRDEARMSWLFDTYEPEIVFHAAAHKHVPLMEQNPEEAILNNVGGTRILLRMAALHGTTRFVNISTDKAVDPINFMGASKRVVELMVQLNDGRESLRATSVRFGNVLGSQGSVTEVFREQLKETRTLTVTDPRMERFFMLIPEAVQLVLQAGALAQGRDIYVLRMGDPIRILDLARSYIKLSGLEVGVDAEIVISGNRGNEKMTEELWTPLEQVVPTSNENILRVECPVIPDVAVVRQAVDNLLNAARSHDVAAMREALHAVDPAINVP